MQDGGAWFFRNSELVRWKAHELSAKVIIEFSDHGKPSDPVKRSDFRRLLQYISENKVDYVIVPHMGMISQTPERFLEMAEKIKQSGVELVSTRGQEADELAHLFARKYKILG
jgi:DNA invertase Pin-like site-specific DNA recombinase